MTSVRAVPTSRLLSVVEHVGSGNALDEDLPPETFVLLHGYGGTSFTWRFWAPLLAERGRALLVDMKGFGAAPKPDDDGYGPGDLADEVVAFLREQDLRGVTLVGHSLGGGVALLASLRLLDLEEHRVVRLVLVAAAAYPQRLPPFVALARRPRLSSLALRAIGAERVVRRVLRSIVADRASVTEEMVHAYAAPLRQPGGLRSALAAGRSIVPPDLDQTTARYGEISCPTLVLWGRRDRVVPLEVGERLARTLPRAHLEVLDRCGHLPPEELPNASWVALSSFLDGVPGVSRPRPAPRARPPRPGTGSRMRTASE